MKKYSFLFLFFFVFFLFPVAVYAVSPEPYDATGDPGVPADVIRWQFGDPSLYPGSYIDWNLTSQTFEFGSAPWDNMILNDSSDLSGTSSDTFILNSDDSSVDVKLQFGTVLNESLQWMEVNSYFFLSDDLVVDGNVNLNGTIFRLDWDEVANPDQDIDIVAGQGTEQDGTIRYDDGNNRWEVSNDGGAFSPIRSGYFGSEYQYAESDAVSTTTSETFQQKLRLTTASIPAGTYRIAWSYQWNHDDDSNGFESRVQVDDTSTIQYHQNEPSDDGGSFGSTGTNQQYTSSGFKNVSLASGVHTVDIDYRTNDDHKKSSIWNVRIEFWRVQ